MEVDPMIAVVLEALPPAGEIWASGQRDAWINVMRGALRQAYPPMEHDTVYKQGFDDAMALQPQGGPALSPSKP